MDKTVLANIAKFTFDLGMIYQKIVSVDENIKFSVDYHKLPDEVAVTFQHTQTGNMISFPYKPEEGRVVIYAYEDKVPMYEENNTLYHTWACSGYVARTYTQGFLDTSEYHKFLIAFLEDDNLCPYKDDDDCHVLEEETQITSLQPLLVTSW